MHGIFAEVAAAHRLPEPSSTFAGAQWRYQASTTPRPLPCVCSAAAQRCAMQSRAAGCFIKCPRMACHTTPSQHFHQTRHWQPWVRCSVHPPCLSPPSHICSLTAGVMALCRPAAECPRACQGRHRPRPVCHALAQRAHAGRRRRHVSRACARGLPSSCDDPTTRSSACGPACADVRPCSRAHSSHASLNLSPRSSCARAKPIGCGACSSAHASPGPGAC